MQHTQSDGAPNKSENMYLTKNGRASQLPCNEIQPTSCIPYHIVQYHTNKKQLALLFFLRTFLRNTLSLLAPMARLRAPFFHTNRAPVKVTVKPTQEPNWAVWCVRNLSDFVPNTTITNPHVGRTGPQDLGKSMNSWENKCSKYPGTIFTKTKPLREIAGSLKGC